ncbi:unnamed protein product, partial [Brenthis ino]
MEPPPRLSFSNSTGASVSCAAHGGPAPTITWLTEDGVPVSDVPGLRSLFPRYTLIQSSQLRLMRVTAEWVLFTFTLRMNDAFLPL